MSYLYVKKSDVIYCVVLATILFAFLVMIENIPDSTWRYKMIVTVDTPEGIKSGWGVREAQVSTGIKLWSEGSSSVKISGEAIAVDLGHRGILFVLIDRETEIPIVYRTFPAAFPPLTSDGVRYYSELQTGPSELSVSLYPKFVHFRNLADPTTVENVLELDRYMSNDGRPPSIHSGIAVDHFQEVFGQGVKLKSVTIQMTKDPVTWGIEKYLPWLPGRKYARGYLGQIEPRGNDPTRTYLRGVDFSLGKFW